jgi:hypothetical protein
MKKLVLPVLMVLVFAVSAQAKIDLRVTGGYTTFAMDDVNRFLHDNDSGTGQVTKVNDGFMLAGDLLFPIESAPNLSLGPRVEYLSCARGKAFDGTNTTTIDQYMIPLMVGGRYVFPTGSSKLSFSGNLFMGVGLGYATVKTQAGSNDYTGSSFAMDAGGESAYKVSDSIDIILDFGYRLAKVDSMSSGGYGGGGSGSSTGGGYSYAPRKASVVDTVTGSSIKYDFSGVFINIGANFRFK